MVLEAIPDYPTLQRNQLLGVSVSEQAEDRIKSGMKHYYHRNYPSLSRNVEEWNF